MKTKRRLIKLAAFIAVFIMLGGCLLTFSGCPLPWYIPKKYSDKKMGEIYSYIKDGLLTNPTNYLAGVEYDDPDGGNAHFANIWNCGGKIIMNFDVYDSRGQAVYYDGVYKKWDRATQTETVTEVSLDEFKPLFDKVQNYADYLKTEVVGTDFSDGYCHECFPWRFGMAQIYYEVDGVSTAASWQVEKNKKKPLVSFAEFDSSASEKSSGASLTVYAEPYDIDGRIPNILQNYEDSKSYTSDEFI